MAAIEVNPSAPQAASELVAQLRAIPVALLSDQLRRNRGSNSLKPYHRPAAMVGTAVTVRTRVGDNLAILRAYDVCRAGDVMVVDGEGDLTNALAGGIMTFGAASLGLAGMVFNGAIRDVAEICVRDFPVYARGVTHRGPYKDGPGAVNVPIQVDGMVVRPGDIVVGDQDGLLCFSPAEAAAVIAAALKQQEAEEATMQSIREGRWDRSFVDRLEARCLN